MTRPARRGPTTTPARLVVPLLLAVLLGGLLSGLLGGCGGDDDAAPPATGPSAGDPATLHLRTMSTTLRTGVVGGRLPRPARERAVRAVGRVVDGWIDAAYVGGTYPRRDFRAAFPGFTPGARRLARADGSLMSNQAIGGRIDGVRPVRRVVAVDLLAAHGHAVGATARVQLGFRTTGALERRFVVRTRLALSRTDGWQVFGFVASTGRAA